MMRSGDPAWDDLGAEEKAVFTRFMAAYAGFLEHTDDSVVIARQRQRTSDRVLAAEHALVDRRAQHDHLFLTGIGRLRPAANRDPGLHLSLAKGPGHRDAVMSIADKVDIPNPNQFY